MSYEEKTRESFEAGFIKQPGSKAVGRVVARSRDSSSDSTQFTSRPKLTELNHDVIFLHQSTGRRAMTYDHVDDLDLVF